MVEQSTDNLLNRQETNIPQGKHLKCRVIEYDIVLPNMRRLILEAPEIARDCVPGQFLQVLCNKLGQFYDPLLRRPFSIHFADPIGGYVSILYDIRGRGTRMLEEKTKEDVVDVIGPLGRGFTIPNSWHGCFLLVSGGMGIAPLYFLLRTLEERFGKDKIKFLSGARTANLVVYRNQIEKHSSEHLISTDDGSYGYHGTVADLLKEYIETFANKDECLVYACGPMPMLKTVGRICVQHNIHCQISVETKMACGVGACMSCVIRVKEPDSGFRYARSCVEGPVFEAENIFWE